ncbi:MAG TPA: sulfotransferase [Gemmatimonadaceae bacterium]
MKGVIILIGAARSGTKLLRDLVATHPQVACVPFDVNFIWRLGNDSVSHDELGPELATPRVRRRIRSRILNFQRMAPWLVEKTVSNSLRVPFVEAVFPEAKYIHLIRDGRDVTESSYRQWTAPPSWRDIARKIPAFPVAQAFGYGARYVGSTLRRAVGGRGKDAAPIWGPVYDGIREDVASRELMDVCALQWQRSVVSAFSAFGALDPERVLTIRYEELVANPDREVARAHAFMGLRTTAGGGLTRVVSTSNVGMGSRGFDVTQQVHIERLIADGLKMAGYPIAI